MIGSYAFIKVSSNNFLEIKSPLHNEIEFGVLYPRCQSHFTIQARLDLRSRARGFYDYENMCDNSSYDRNFQ